MFDLCSANALSQHLGGLHKNRIFDDPISTELLRLAAELTEILDRPARKMVSGVEAVVHNLVELAKQHGVSSDKAPDWNVQATTNYPEGGRLSRRISQRQDKADQEFFAAIPEPYAVAEAFEPHKSTGKPLPDKRVAALLGHGGTVHALAQLSESRLASASLDNSIRIWRLPRGNSSKLSCSNPNAPDLHTSATTEAATAAPAAAAAAAAGGGGGGGGGAGALTATALPSTAPKRKYSSGSDRASSTGNVFVSTGQGDRGQADVDEDEGACLSVLRGHDGDVNTVIAMSHNIIASGSDDETVKLWNVEAGCCYATLEGHTDAVWALVALGASRIASGSWDHTIKLWDTSSCKLLATLIGHSDAVRALAVVSKARLASGSHDSTIKLWDLANCSCAMTLLGHSSYVNALCYLGQDRLASGSDDTSIRIWDLEGGFCLTSLVGHTSWVHSLTVLSGYRLASGGQDGDIRLWDWREGELLKILSDVPDRENEESEDSRQDEEDQQEDPTQEERPAGRQEDAAGEDAEGRGQAMDGAEDDKTSQQETAGKRKATASSSQVANLQTNEFLYEKEAIYSLSTLPDGRLLCGLGQGDITIWGPS